jgi:hypothetical protein
VKQKGLLIWQQWSLTSTTESRAASATISAQETTPGHVFSSCVFAASITSYPLTVKLGPDFFSTFGF